MAIDIIKCKQCGANINADPAKDTYVCEYCGASYVNNRPVHNHNKNIHNDIKSTVTIHNVSNVSIHYNSGSGNQPPPVNQQTTYRREDVINRQPKKVTPVQGQIWFILLMLVLFFPLGIYFMWRYKRVILPLRIMITSIIIFLAAMYIWGSAAMSSYESTKEDAEFAQGLSEAERMEMITIADRQITAIVYTAKKDHELILAYLDHGPQANSLEQLDQLIENLGFYYDELDQITCQDITLYKIAARLYVINMKLDGHRIRTALKKQTDSAYEEAGNQIEVTRQYGIDMDNARKEFLKGAAH